jgi:hypothetical protein
MDMTLALDPGSAPVAGAEPRTPGSDPNDATSVAFAALLASLVAGAVPPPTPTGAPVADPATAPAASAAAAPATALGVPALPALAAPATPPAVPAEPALPALAMPPAPTATDVAAAAAPAPAPAPAAPPEVAVELAPTRLSPPRPIGAAIEGPPAAEVTNGEVAAARPAPATPKREGAAPVRPTATPLPTAVTAVATGSASTDTAPQGDGDREADHATPVSAVTQPSALESAAPAAPFREVLKPEIVSGPRPAGAATPVQQVVRAVVPLRRLADGTHNMVLELHPAELGAVRVELSLDRGVVHLGLHADLEGTGQLLRAALPELRSQLDAAGLVSGRVAVDGGPAGRGGDGQPSWRTEPDRARRRGPADDEVEDPVATAYSTADYGHVDVLL